MENAWKWDDLFCFKKYVSIERGNLWEVLWIHGGKGDLLEAQKSVYQESKACIHVGREDNEVPGKGNSVAEVCDVTMVV